MERKYGSVKALSADGTWNKWRVNLDTSYPGAKYDASAFTPEQKRRNGQKRINIGAGRID
jgi:hypothetical protein